MMEAGTPKGFQRIGLDGQFPIALYDTDDWYETEEMFLLAGKEAEKFLKQKDIFELTALCEMYLNRGRKEIPVMNDSDEDPKQLFQKFLDLIRPANCFIWVAHASEAYYHPLIQHTVAEYVPKERVETFIGDISFPAKKNALALMNHDIHQGLSLEELHKKYAWIKARGGFRSEYSLSEMGEIQQKILGEPRHEHPLVSIPDELQNLALQIQELVYLRTLRTDALYEMYHLAQPLFRRVEQSYGIACIKDYIPDELISGRCECVPHEYAIIKSYDDVLVVRESIVSRASAEETEARGVVAYRGMVVGRVRVLEHAKDSEKVERGDVIVASMTNPSYISAMHKASAFVTDEGGITCHAAIIAREMKKPCVIGTKIATQIFKDGDMVEVDAEKGIVRKVSSRE